MSNDSATNKKGTAADPPKKATSRDIARICGVSQTTVSYVMNNTPGASISEKTRRLVLQTAKELNYVPNNAARGMRMRAAYSIGVVVGRNAVSIGFNHILRGIKRTMDEAGYSITLLQDDTGLSTSSDVPEYLAYLRSGRIDGVIFCFYDLEPAQQQALDEAGAAYLIAGDNGILDGAQNFPIMLRDAITQIVQLCVEKKWRDIRFFSFQYGKALFSRKFDLFSEVLHELNPSAHLSRQIIQAQDRDTEKIQEELLEVIRTGGFELAVTPHQRLGMLVQRTIMYHRLQLPQEPKHICLDATHALQIIYPSVTSLKIPLTEIGEESGRQILRKIAGKPLEVISFRSILVPGASTE